VAPRYIGAQRRNCHRHRWPRLVSRREVVSVDDAMAEKNYRFELMAAP
jgi:hypothetical protein